LPSRDPRCYANGIRVVRQSPEEPADTILVAGSGLFSSSLVALGSEKKPLWTMKLPSGFSHIYSMATSPQRPWLACSGMEGGILVVDCVTGKIIGKRSGTTGMQVETELGRC